MQRPEKVRKRGEARSSRQRLFPVLVEASSLLDLRLTFDQVEGFAEFIWSQPNSETRVAVGRVRCTGADQLTWEIEKDGQRESTICSHRRNSIREATKRWLNKFPTNCDTFRAFWIRTEDGSGESILEQEPPFNTQDIYPWIEDNLV